MAEKTVRMVMSKVSSVCLKRHLKNKEIRHPWFPREMTSEKRAKKIHIDNTLVPLIGRDTTSVRRLSSHFALEQQLVF